MVVGQLIEKNWKDEDIKEDVEHVKGVLDEMLQDMSTFDSYLAEVRKLIKYCRFQCSGYSPIWNLFTRS